MQTAKLSRGVPEKPRGKKRGKLSPFHFWFTTSGDATSGDVISGDVESRYEQWNCESNLYLVTIALLPHFSLLICARRAVISQDFCASSYQ
jgi:hypothetical protein